MPETIGSKELPLTPLPLHVPPTGDSPASVIAPLFRHTVSSGSESVAVGGVCSTNVIVSLDVHPPGIVAVTKYVPEAVTMLVCPVLRSFQVYVAPGFIASNITETAHNV